MNDLLKGRFVNKHNQLDADVTLRDRAILGSVRDPWEWYTSLWAYGCDSKGAIFNRVTGEKRSGYRGLGWKTNPLFALKTLLLKNKKKSAKWRRTYQDVDDPGAFREWLFMVHDRDYWDDLGDDYGKYQISSVGGLLTFRYLKLFCCKIDETKKLSSIRTFEELVQFERKSCMVEHFIRNEELESDLIETLTYLKIPISPKQRNRIMSASKTNRSSRRFGPKYFYDQESESLVLSRERLIVEKFHYTPPSLQRGKSRQIDSSNIVTQR